MRAEKTIAFDQVMRCDDPQVSNTRRPQPSPPLDEDPMRDSPVCNCAPEWAEHARFARGDDPCDDGRAGTA